jgi:hypothetical protein
MRIAMLIAATALLAACGNHSGADGNASGAAQGVNIPIVNGDFEQASSDAAVPGWVTLQHNGPPSYEMVVEPAAAYAGHGGFRMTRTNPQVYGTLAQDVHVPPSVSEVELSAMLKSKDVGPGGWKLMLIAGALPEYSTPMTGTTDWQHVTVRAKIKPGAKSLRIGVTLLDAGTGWLDDVRLTAIAP